MLLLLLLIITISTLFLFWAAIRNNNYWKKKGIPGPKPLPLKGNIDQIFGKNIAAIQKQKWSKEFGSVYGIKNGWFNELVISDPVMVKHVFVDKFEKFHGRAVSPLVGDVDTKKLIPLFFAKGKRWKRLRAIANPAFSISNLKRVMPIIDDSIKVNIQLLRQAELSGIHVDLHKYFDELTFDIISRIAMGQKDSRQFNSEFCKMAHDVFALQHNNIFDYIAFIFPWIGKNILDPFVAFTGKIRNDPLQLLIGKIYEAVKQRKEEKMKEGEEQKEENLNKRRVDFIDLFLESEVENNEVDLTKNNGNYSKTDKFERHTILEEIVLNCVLFLLAGFDTTSNNLSLMAHYLVMYPEVQKRLFEEIEEVCGDGEEMPSYEELAKLKYVDAVFKETQRLCPIASGVTRICEETTTLGGIIVEKGTNISIDLLTLHRDPKLWGEDAEEFKPERWLNGEELTFYYPFGGGPRICIGLRFAIMETKMILVRLLKTFELKRCLETETELKFCGQIVLNPGKVFVELKLRK
uniref:Cytochrome P450 n=1 Tax=Meloidogyne incognita TaxID=6306 RepID=A0A914MK33_MELIC